MYAFLWLSLVDLVYVKTDWDDILKNTFPMDLFMALVISYNIIEYTPMFIINTIMLVKELTLNPMALTKDEDWEQGKMFNVIDIDPFDWLGIDEDVSHYAKYLSDFGKKYF